MVGRKNRDDDWRDDFSDNFFGDFDIDFKKLNERMTRIFDTFRKNVASDGEEPFVYGFTFKMGPDGKPQFQEFGNVPELRRYNPSLAADAATREPITDINEDKEKVYITVELPGINKDDIDLSVNEDSVVISVTEGSRKYYKSVDLREPVIPDSASAKFTNGILDLTLTKQRKGETGGKKVKIE